MNGRAPLVAARRGRDSCGRSGLPDQSLRRYAGTLFPLELFPKITSWGGLYKSQIAEFSDLNDVRGK